MAEEFMVEEILSISRTMAETAINAAFLQFSEDDELKRFQHFDAQSLYKHSKKLQPLTSFELSDEREAELQGAIGKARSVTQLGDNAPSWSKTHPTPIARAEFIETRMADSMMPALVLTTYNWAHRAVHSTGDALRPFYKALGSGEIPSSQERTEELQRALSFVVFCLEIYAFFCDRFLHQNRQAEIVEIATKNV
jgi:hypothetical protein